MKNSTKAIKTIAFLFFLAYALSLLIPVYYLVLNSFKRNSELFLTPWALPKKFSFENYINAFSSDTFSNNSLGLMFLNSLIFTLGSTAVSLAAVTTFAYTVTRFDFPGRNFLRSLAVAMYVIPPLATAAATYKLVYDFGLNDNWLFIVVMNLSPFGLGYFMVSAFVKGVAKAYTEAAVIDGANEWVLFFKIIIPQIIPVIAVLGLLGVIGAWNNYETPYLYFRSKPFLSTGLRSLTAAAENNGYYVEMYAAIIISMLPIIILFTFAHDVILKNTVLGGIKG